MRLDRLIINLRERTPWEAMDLGTRLVISLTKKIIIPWVSILIIFTTMSVYIQASGYPWTGLFLFWLFKPVYDSLLLFILSNELFSEKLSPNDVFKNLFVWLKPGLKHSIYWWRLSPVRSFSMPVHNLEGLTGGMRKKRLKILQKDTSGYAVGLTIMALNYELLINMSIYMLIAFFIPDELYSTLWSFFESADETTAGLIFNTLIYALTVFLIEPLYLSAGFLLYLNRRVKLEAWDIELVFKQINNRLEKQFHNVIN